MLFSRHMSRLRSTEYLGKKPGQMELTLTKYVGMAGGKGDSQPRNLKIAPVQAVPLLPVDLSWTSPVFVLPFLYGFPIN